MKKLNLYSSLQPMLFLIRMFGFFPYSFEFNLKKKLKFSLIWFLWSMFVISTIFSAMIVLLNLKKNSQTTLSEVWRSITIFQCVLVISQQTYQIAKGDKITKFLIDIQNFDTTAMISGIFMEYKHHRVEIALSTSFIIVVMMFLSFLAFLLSEFFGFINYQMQMTGYYQSLFLFTNTIQFYTLCKMIKLRFEKINEYLQFVLSQKFDDKFLEKIFKFNSLHHSLSTIMQDFNDIFVFNATQSLLMILLQTIFVMYELVILIYFGYGDKNFVPLMIDKTSWLSFHFILLTIFCHSGHSLTKSASRSEEILIERISQSKILNRIDQLHSSYVRLKLQDKTIQNVFIAINWKLIFMVI